MEDEKRIWGIHTQDDSLFLKGNVIAIGWKAFGDLSNMENNREAFKQKYAEIYLEDKKAAVAVAAGMLYRFRFEIQVGDYVVFPSKSNHEINIGIVDGEYRLWIICLAVGLYKECKKVFRDYSYYWRD